MRGLGLRIPWAAGTRLDPASYALIARMTAAPGAARAGRIDALVRALKAAGVWSRLDALYLLAAHDAQAARLNWVANAWNLAAVNSPAFTVDRGYAGNATTSYLDSGFKPGVSAGLAAQNDCHVGVWPRTESAVTVADIGNSGTFIFPRTTGGNINTRVMDGSTASVAVPGSVGHFVASRSGAGGYARYRNGASVGDAAVASAAPAGANLLIGARGNTGSADFHSARQIAAAHCGAGLSAGQVAALHAALATYLAAAGAA